MKSRIQSIEQLKEIAIQELQTQIDQQISDALLDGAAQGMAFVMWILELNFGWKDKRQHQLFDSMNQILSLGADWLKPLEGTSLIDHMKDTFGINIDELLRSQCSTSVAQQNPDVKAAGN